MTTVIFRSIRMPARASTHTHIAWRLPATNVGRESKESKQVQNFICKWLKIGVLIRAALHNSQLSARSIEHPIRIHTHTFYAEFRTVSRAFISSTTRSGTCNTDDNFVYESFFRRQNRDLRFTILYQRMAGICVCSVFSIFAINYSVEFRSLKMIY